MSPGEMSGLRKAAVLLLTMDEDMSKDIIKDLDQEEIGAIGQEIARLKFVPDDIVKLVHNEFMKKLDKNSATSFDGESKFKDLMKKSLGNEKAEMYIDSIGSKEALPGEFLRACDPKLLANTIRGEHPQTIALVLSVLSSKRACEGISLLPGKIQGDVMMRMAYMEKVDQTVLRDIESVLREQLESVGFGVGRQLGGIDMVANILNQMDKTRESELLGKIEEIQPDLAERIRQLMFTFEDLVHIDDKGIQVLLKEISSEELPLALKGASEDLKAKFFANMSERACAMLKEDLEAMGPVRLSDVEQTHIKIAMTAKKLDLEGKIAISTGNETFI